MFLLQSLRQLRGGCIAGLRMTNQNVGRCLMAFAMLAALPAIMAEDHQTRHAPSSQSSPVAGPKIDYVDIASRAGLLAKTYAGSETRKKYIIETTGSGVAFFD